MSTPTERLIAISFISIPIIIVLSVIVNSIVFKILWGWFVSGTFGITQIGYLQAAGLVLIPRLLMLGYANEGKRVNKEEFRAKIKEYQEQNQPAMVQQYMKKSITSPIISAITTGVFVPVFLLILGSLIRLIM